MRRVVIILVGLLAGAALLGGCTAPASGPTRRAPVDAPGTQSATPLPPTPTPRPTRTPTGTPSPTRTPMPGPPTAREDANLRAGPGVAFAQVGSVQAGDVLQLVATNPGRDWVQVIQGPWLLADVVANVPDLPIVDVPTGPPPTRPPTAGPAPTPKS